MRVAGREVGWWAGFGLAGVGMLFGWLCSCAAGSVLHAGPRTAAGRTRPAARTRVLKKPCLARSTASGSSISAALLGVGLVWLLVQREPIVNVGADHASFGIAGVLRLLHDHGAAPRRAADPGLHPGRRRWCSLRCSSWLARRSRSSPNALRSCQRRSSVSPPGRRRASTRAFILIFAPIFAMMWTWLNGTGRDPGMEVCARPHPGRRGFLVLVWGAQYADASSRFR